MGDNPEFDSLGFWSRHRYLLLIIASIFISVGLVAISMALYFSSGAAQLDLSRPGYSAVADQVDNSKDFQAYSSVGAIDEASIKEFEEAFEEQSKKVTQTKAFSGDPLNPKSLQVNSPK